METQIEVLCGLKGQKIWHVMEDMLVATRYGKVHIPASFHHDKYTFAPDLSSEIPAIVHDSLVERKVFADGTPCSRRQADRILYDLILRYDAVLILDGTMIPAKVIAPLYYVGTRIGAAWSWLK